MREDGGGGMREDGGGGCGVVGARARAGMRTRNGLIYFTENILEVIEYTS
jgi:hypothetical protein